MSAGPGNRGRAAGGPLRPGCPVLGGGASRETAEKRAPGPLRLLGVFKILAGGCVCTGGREGVTLMCVRNSYWSPSIHIPTGDQTRSLGVCQTSCRTPGFRCTGRCSRPLSHPARPAGRLCDRVISHPQTETAQGFAVGFGGGGSPGQRGRQRLGAQQRRGSRARAAGPAEGAQHQVWGLPPRDTPGSPAPQPVGLTCVRPVGLGQGPQGQQGRQEQQSLHAAAGPESGGWRSRSF